MSEPTRTLFPLKDTDPMPFGAHKGKQMQDVPAGYIDWLVGQTWIDKFPQIVEYVETNRSAIDKELEEQGLL